MNIIMRCTTYLVLAAFIVNVASNAARAQGRKKTMQLRVFFINPHSPDFATTCAAGEFVNRTIPVTNEVANAALSLVFSGPTM